jgi:hypothetical protein
VAIAKYPTSIKGKNQLEEFLLLLVGECRGRQRMAAIRAGVPAASAATWSTDILKVPEVRERWFELREQKCDELNITADRILREYQAIAFANIMNYTRDGVNGKVFDLDELTRAEGAAIQEITIEDYEEHDPDGEDDNATRSVKRTKIKLHPKLPALEQLAKYRGIQGIGVNKIDFSNPDGSLMAAQPITVIFVDAEDGRPLLASGNIVEGE